MFRLETKLKRTTLALAATGLGLGALIWFGTYNSNLTLGLELMGLLVIGLMVSLFIRQRSALMWQRMLTTATILAMVAQVLLPFSHTPLAPTALAANIIVDDLGDVVGADGVCTLREAINNANVALGGDTTGGDCVAGAAGLDNITFSVAGTITIVTNGGAANDDNASDDFDITDDLIIDGGGTIVVDGGGNGRVFDTPSGGPIVDLRNMTIQNGSMVPASPARSVGGGVRVFSGRVTLEGVTVTGNEINRDSNLGANNSVGGGGVAVSQGNELRIYNSTISNNQTNGDNNLGGGVFAEDGSTLVISNTTISGNTVNDGWGGGVGNEGGGTTTIIDNSTISGNSASAGGGGVAADGNGTVGINFTTITNNTAANGGGVYASDDFNGPNGTTPAIGLGNSIVAANIATTANPDCDMVNGGSVTSAAITPILIGDNTGGCSANFPAGQPNANGDIVGTAGAVVDPLFNALTNNGGTTETHEIRDGSPAIDQSGFGCTLTYTDQRGTLQFDVPNFGSGTCDLGSYEFDGPLPTVSIADSSETEGNAGTVNMTFTVSLDFSVNYTVTVQYDTTDGSATAPADYTAAVAQTVDILPGDTSATFPIVVQGDTDVEGNHDFTVTLSNQVYANIGTGTATGTIIDDDGSFPTVDIADAPAVLENSGGTADFPLTLSAVSTEHITVTYSTADNTATNLADYTGVTAVDIVFAPGETSKTISIAILDDVAFEGDETFFVNLIGIASGATIGTAQGTGTITEDDTATLSVNDVTVAEGAGGTTTDAVFTITLAPSSVSAVTVDYATDTTGTATSGEDYVAGSGSVTFAPGETTKTFTVTVNGDDAAEPDETFNVNLSNASPTAVTFSDSNGVGTITNDDGSPPELSVTSVSVIEGNPSAKGATLLAAQNAIFVVTLSAASTLEITVDYTTVDGTAVAGTDYTATSGTLTFSPGGALTQQVIVPITGDTDVESDETFTLDLSNPDDAVLSATASSGTGTITNDDAEETTSGGGDSGGSDDDDDDGGSTAAPPPASAPATSVTAPTTDSAAEMPVTTLPETGVDGGKQATGFPWWMVAVVAVGIIGLGFSATRLRSKSQQAKVEVMTSSDDIESDDTAEMNPSE